MKNTSYHIFAMTTIFFWSVAYVLTRLSVQYFTPFSLGFLRYLVASIALIVVVIAMKLKAPKLKSLPWFIASGGVGSFLYMVTYNSGQALSTAATASVVIATVPVITALMSLFFFKEKLGKLQWVAIALEFAGVVVLTLLDGQLSVNGGLVWLLLAALMLASYNLLNRKLTKEYSGLQVSTYSIFLGTLMLTVFAPGAVSEAMAAPPIQFIYLAILGVGSGAIAYVCWAVAFSKAPKASQVSNYMFLTPLVTTLLGIIIAGEFPDMPTILGGAIILCGVFVFNFGDRIFKK